MGSQTGQDTGIDGNKKIKGSKRHLIVDTMGLIICVAIHAASIHDSKGAKEVFEKRYAVRHEEVRMQKIVADGGYEGDLAEWLNSKLHDERQASGDGLLKTLGIGRKPHLYRNDDLDGEKY